MRACVLPINKILIVTWYKSAAPNVRRLVNPAALLPSIRKLHGERFPKTKRAVTNRELGAAAQEKIPWADADFLVGPTTAKTVDGLQINLLVRLDDDLVVGGSRRVLLEEGRNPTLPRRRTRRSGRWSS